jgi:branched-subunit amino acid transport protein
MILLNSLNFSGLLVGLATFIIIGIFHPLVIKGYYYFGLKCRWWFLFAGILSLIAAILVKNFVASSLLGVTAFSCFWSIKEVIEQAERVRKGWFPDNPNRK